MNRTVNCTIWHQIRDADAVVRPTVRRLPFGFQQTWKPIKNNKLTADQIDNVLARLHCRALAENKILVLQLVDDPEIRTPAASAKTAK